MIPNRFTKIKIAVGYSLLLAVLLFSLLFVRREMENLAASDNQQSLQSDSLLLLLREKDQNTIRMLRTLSEASESESMLSSGEIEEIIAEQDTVITRQRVQRRVISKRDTLITKPKKRGFFKRLGEVFAPSKPDTALLVNTSLEFATDTILEPYHVADSLHQKLRSASQQKQAKRKTIRRDNVQFRRLNTELTARIDTLVRSYEQEVLLRARRDAERGREIRQRSTRIIGSIAIGAVLLSAFFLILILRDITRSNRYRRQLEEANRRAADLLEAREKLMLAITHDFKAPLGSIMGYTDLLARLTEDERQRFYLDNMKSSSSHLLKLVNDLLDFHRLDLNKGEVNRVTFHPAHLFEEIRVSFEPLTAAKGLALKYEIAPELDGSFISDPLRIRQIVNNLISNAVKFTAQGEVRLLVGYSSSRLTVEVADTGKGMAPEDRERIFQEFTRLPGAQGEEGFGLGLSIVRKLIVLLEGKIEVESIPGKGSRFIVTLPLYPVGASRTGRFPCGEVACTESICKGSTPNGNLPVQEALREALRVLLIDDDKIQLSLTAAMLGQQGITAVCCEQLEELTEHLRTSSFDLLLTDVQMPAINGFDLLKLLRASNIAQARTIPVIAVTARSDMQQQEFVAHGFAGCLHKPFTVAELLAMVGSREPSLEREEARGETPVASPDINFALLTTFSEGDAEAARSIIQTFVEETQKNLTSMSEALARNDVDGVAAMAHKLLPLLTYIGASRVLPLLTWLEAHRGESASEEWRQKSSEALPIVAEVIERGRQYSEKL